MPLAALVDQQDLLAVLELVRRHRDSGSGRKSAATKPASGISAQIHERRS